MVVCVQKPTDAKKDENGQQPQKMKALDGKLLDDKLPIRDQILQQAAYHLKTSLVKAVDLLWKNGMKREALELCKERGNAQLARLQCAFGPEQAANNKLGMEVWPEAFRVVAY